MKSDVWIVIKILTWLLAFRVDVLASCKVNVNINPMSMITISALALICWQEEVSSNKQLLIKSEPLCDLQS